MTLQEIYELLVEAGMFVQESCAEQGKCQEFLEGGAYAVGYIANRLLLEYGYDGFEDDTEIGDIMSALESACRAGDEE